MSNVPVLSGLQSVLPCLQKSLDLKGEAPLGDTRHFNNNNKKV